MIGLLGIDPLNSRSNCVCTLPYSYSFTDPYTNSDNMQKGYTGTNTDDDTDAMSQWNWVKVYLISNKLGTVAIGIGIGIGIGISVGSEETVLLVIIGCISIGISVRDWFRNQNQAV